MPWPEGAPARPLLDAGNHGPRPLTPLHRCRSRSQALTPAAVALLRAHEPALPHRRHGPRELRPGLSQTPADMARSRSRLATGAPAPACVLGRPLRQLALTLASPAACSVRRPVHPLRAGRKLRVPRPPHAAQAASSAHQRAAAAARPRAAAASRHRHRCAQHGKMRREGRR